MQTNNYNFQANQVIIINLINNNGTQPTPVIKSPPKKPIDWMKLAVDSFAFIKKHWHKIVLLIGMLVPN